MLHLVHWCHILVGLLVLVGVRVLLFILVHEKMFHEAIVCCFALSHSWSWSIRHLTLGQGGEILSYEL
jgi:hypothetical protein